MSNVISSDLEKEIYIFDGFWENYPRFKSIPKENWIHNTDNKFATYDWIGQADNKKIFLETKQINYASDYLKERGGYIIGAEKIDFIKTSPEDDFFAAYWFLNNKMLLFNLWKLAFELPVDLKFWHEREKQMKTHKVYYIDPYSKVAELYVPPDFNFAGT